MISWIWQKNCAVEEIGALPSCHVDRLSGVVIMMVFSSSKALPLGNGDPETYTLKPATLKRYCSLKKWVVTR
jgi:hypothetical protein